MLRACFTSSKPGKGAGSGLKFLFKVCGLVEHKTRTSCVQINWFVHRTCSLSGRLAYKLVTLYAVWSQFIHSTFHPNFHYLTEISWLFSPLSTAPIRTRIKDLNKFIIYIYTFCAFRPKICVPMLVVPLSTPRASVLDFRTNCTKTYKYLFDLKGVVRWSYKSLRKI
jgi:hypothetical protein